MAHQDAIFVTFFGRDKEAAMLACDELGVYPMELLYLPKGIFLHTAPSEEHALVRYAMRERSRQQMFRKLTALRSKLVASGNVQELWAARTELMPDGPFSPELDPAVVAQAATHVDTESDDDGYDEYFRPRPPGYQKQQRQLITSPAGPSSSTTAENQQPKSPGATRTKGGLQQESGSPTRRGTTSASFSQQQSPAGAEASSLSMAMVKRKPVPPRQPPVLTHVNKATLSKQEKLLDVHRKRLAKFAIESSSDPNQQNSEKPMGQHDVSRGSRGSRQSIGLIDGQRSSKSESSSLDHTQTSDVYGGTIPQLHSTSSTGALSHAPLSQYGRGGSGAVVVSDGMPPLGPSQETKRQMNALLKGCMSTIVESAVGHSTWRATFEREEAEREARERAKLQLCGRGGPTRVLINGEEMILTPQELFRKRELAAQQKKQYEHDVQLIKAIQAEERQAEVVRKVEVAIERQRQRQVLDFEAQRMKQLLAEQKREWRARAEEVRLARLIAKSMPKYEHAEEVRQRKIMSADISRQAHTQLALMRRQVKDSLATMVMTKDWDVPDSLSEMLSPELLGIEGATPENQLSP